ncbi:MAG TPA: helix-turn-helix domain-containing protein [Vitreimonas sp.]|uniref:helix-turn-helix domain-containing protein n=1 Tax=Vitreimonas sp. TaxID=3069702 RepID=UPI002D3BFDA9|nr:helix-turn-helix domain-containing protein [Vitreimonas sp.]HYD89103.1 helix-turn-helix domain-containing protein [Vitreimonas sp.]
MTKKRKIRIGSSFDSFFKEQGGYEDTQAVAIKRVLAWQVERAMREENVTKAEMARRMNTSRSQLVRLLDPENHAVSLETLTGGACWGAESEA